MARCGCSGECGCVLTAGEGVIVSGGGSLANPWVVSTTTDCPTVRTCLTGGDGIDYNQASGLIQVDLSTDPGNIAVFGTDDGLYVPNGMALVDTDCGILGDGSPGDPVRANTGTWTWPCTLDTTNGRPVYCDPATGQLLADPEHETRFRSFTATFTYPNLAVPVAANTVIQAVSASTTNPSICRTQQIMVIQEADIYFSLPAGAEAAWGHDTDEFGHFKNTDAAVAFTDYHWQSSKMIGILTNLAAGGPVTHNWNVTMGRGVGGATYHRVEVATRFLMITN